MSRILRKFRDGFSSDCSTVMQKNPVLNVCSHFLTLLLVVQLINCTSSSAQTRPDMAVSDTAFKKLLLKLESHISYGTWLGAAEVQQLKTAELKLKQEVESLKRTNDSLSRHIKVKDGLINGLETQSNSVQDAIFKQTDRINARGQFLMSLIKSGNQQESELREKIKLLAMEEERIKTGNEEIGRKKIEIHSQNLTLEHHAHAISLQNKYLKQQKHLLEEQLKEIDQQNFMANLQMGQLKTRRLTITLSLVILVSSLGFVFYLFRSNLSKQKAFLLLEEQRLEIDLKNHQLHQLNTEIETQRTLIEEKKAELEESIQYARYIQQALLPPQTGLSELFPDNLVLYAPVHMISGSFYYFKQLAQKTVVLIGSGNMPSLPGSFIGLICIETLEEHISSGSVIMNKLLKEIDQAIKNALPHGSSDSIDIGIVCVNHEQHTLEMAGANVHQVFIPAGLPPVTYKPAYKSIGFKKQTFSQFPVTVSYKNGDAFFLINNGLLKKVNEQQLAQAIAAEGKLSELPARLLSSEQKSLQTEDWILTGASL